MIWNLAVGDPCCSAACVQQALTRHPCPLTPSAEIFVAQSLSIAVLTPAEYHIRRQHPAADDFTRTVVRPASTRVS
jgi:hypothetical protein